MAWTVVTLEEINLNNETNMNEKYIRPYEFFLKNERELQNRTTFKNFQKHTKKHCYQVIYQVQ